MTNKRPGRAYPLDSNEWANQAVHLIDVALESAEKHGDYDDARFRTDEATVLALLAIATELRTNGEATRQREQLQRNAEQMRTYLDNINPPEQFQNIEITDSDLDAAIEDLAERLWAGDPGNQANPARRFQDDYTHRQDQYRAMARVALGLNDEPQDKNGRRP